MRISGIHPAVAAVIVSWLRTRKANVVVGGTKSSDFDLDNMLFQGTVWGPTLWNIFYADAKLAIREWLLTEIVFADDFNAYQYQLGF